MTDKVSSQVSRQNGQIEKKSIRELKKLWKKTCKDPDNTDSGTRAIEENFR